MLLLAGLSRGGQAFATFGYRARFPMTARRFMTAGPSNESSAPQHTVYIAVGSNLGDRFANIDHALRLLCEPQETDDEDHPARLVSTSFLRETEPMYLADQPNFLNGAVKLETTLSPRSLLQKIKSIESQLGRNLDAARNAPRLIDMDILFYETTTSIASMPCHVQVDETDLVIPHPLIQEREFVLEPLIDMVGRDYLHPGLNEGLGRLLDAVRGSAPSKSRAVRVIPLPRNRLLRLNETVIMGILNVTPDSFSDGGCWTKVEIAVAHALEMVQHGAGIIDIGGESTRPGAKEIDVEEQISRSIPVIEILRQVSDVAISIDTRHAPVAKAAIEAGADVVNDVSGGNFDDNMIPTVAGLAVPMVIMHMRGTPETMQSKTDYSDVVQDVGEALCEQSERAQREGVNRWLQLVDPGIGFAKNLEGNLSLLKNLSAIRKSTGNLPILLGPSRKGFIKQLTGIEQAEARDPGTIAAIVSSLTLDATSDAGNLVRVHNVPACKQAVIVMDAIRHA